MCLGRGLWGTATDVSSVGDTRRGREGDSGDVGLRFELVRLWDRGFGSIFEGLCEPWLGGGDSSDNRASSAIHPSMSQSDVDFGSRLDDLVNRGMWVTKEVVSGRTGERYTRGNACGGLVVLNGQGLWGKYW